MCKAAGGKRLTEYNKTVKAKAFMEALKSETGKQRWELHQTIQGGPIVERGTWVHPQIAIHVAMWISPEFAVQVMNWVFKWADTREENEDG